MKVIDLNILVIGNGFDLALGWPSKYTDFLNFIKVFQIAYNNKDYQDARVPEDCIRDLNDRIDRYPMEDEKKTLESLKPFWDGFSEAFTFSEANQVFRDFHFCIYKNRWIEYFEYRYDRQLIAGENWIDLEKEIKEAIKVLENDSIAIGNRESFFNDTYEVNNTIKDLIKKIQDEKKENRKYHLPAEAYAKLRSSLICEFDKFVMALGIYIDFFIRTIYEECDIQRDIYRLLKLRENDKIDHVLSFNYINNYNAKYSGVKQGENNTCTVHGSVNYMYEIRNLTKNEKKYDYDSENIKRIIEKNKMIIGFDEYRDDDAKNKQLDFIYYRKYFQRILKGTGSQYLEWLGQNELNNIYIFGCSLDATDKEIIKDLFLRKPVHTKIKIYYHDEEAHNRMIMNLISILTQEKVIEMTSGINPDIEFVAQTKWQK